MAPSVLLRAGAISKKARNLRCFSAFYCIVQRRFWAIYDCILCVCLYVCVVLCVIVWCDLAHLGLKQGQNGAIWGLWVQIVTLFVCFCDMMIFCIF